MQGDLCCHVLQRLHFEVRCAHPSFDRPKQMLNGPATQWDLVGITVKTLLYPPQDMLMFPAADATLLAGRTSVLNHAGPTVVCPVIAKRLAILAIRIMVRQPIASRALLGIFLSIVDKVRSIKASPGCRIGRVPLGDGDGDAGLLASNDLFAFVVAFVGDCFDRIAGHLVARLVRHHRKGIAVITVVRHLVRDDQMVFGFDSALHVVADHTGLLARRCHSATVRVRQRHLRLAGVVHSAAQSRGACLPPCGSEPAF